MRARFSLPGAGAAFTCALCLLLIPREPCLSEGSRLPSQLQRGIAGIPAAHPNPGLTACCHLPESFLQFRLTWKKIHRCVYVCICVCIHRHGPQETPIWAPPISEGCTQVAAAPTSILLSQSGECAGDPSQTSLAGFSNQSKRTNQQRLGKVYFPKQRALPTPCLASGRGHQSRPLQRSLLRRLRSGRGIEASSCYRGK